MCFTLMLGDKMMNKISALFIASFLAVSSAWASVAVIWATDVGKLALQSNGITPLAAGTSATAGFCQLIYIGAAYDGLGSSGDGALGDDVILQTTWIGTGTMSAAGTLSGSYNNTTYAVGSQFVIRFFDTPSPSYGITPDGLVPTTGNYGLSQIYTTTQVHNAAPATESFYFSSNYAANIAVVPEPRTVALMLAGLGVLGFARMRRK
jgi:hypothetical protein